MARGISPLARFAAGTVCLISCFLCALPLVAGSSATDAAKPGSTHGAALGMVVLSRDATLDGRPVLPSQTVFSGEKLEVKDGAAEVMLSQGNRLSFGKDTVASFELSGEVTHAILDHGDLRFLHPEHGGGLLVRSGEVSIFPMAGGNTQAEINAGDRFLTVAAVEGTVRVEGQGENRQASKGEALRFHRVGDQISDTALPGPQDTSTSTASASGPTTPPPPAAATGSRSIDWSCIEYCTLPAAAGTAGVIVALELGSVGSSMTPTSPAPIWPWGLIPVGAAAGDLVCYLRGTCGTTKAPPPPECTLTEVPGAAGAPDTLVWKTANATAADLEPGFGAEPLSGSAPARKLTPGEKAEAYMLKVTGVDGSTVVCMADVKAPPPAKANCECTLDFEVPADKCETKGYKVKWTSTNTEPKGNKLTAIGVNTITKGDKTLATYTVGSDGDRAPVSGATRYEFTPNCKPNTVPPKDGMCTLKTPPDPSCSIAFAGAKTDPASSDDYTYKLNYSTENAVCAQLQGLYNSFELKRKWPVSIPVGKGLTYDGKHGRGDEEANRWSLTVTGEGGTQSSCSTKEPVALPNCFIYAEPTPVVGANNKITPDKFTLQWKVVNPDAGETVSLPPPCKAPAAGQTEGSCSGATAADLGGLGIMSVKTDQFGMRYCKVTLPPKGQSPPTCTFTAVPVPGKKGQYTLNWSVKPGTGEREMQGVQLPNPPCSAPWNRGEAKGSCGPVSADAAAQEFRIIVWGSNNLINGCTATVPAK